MITTASHIPRFVSFEEELDDILSDIQDTVNNHPHYGWGAVDPIFGRSPTRSKLGKKYIISIDVGRQYQLKDIITNMEERKLKVSGQTKQIFPHGVNTHGFERSYDIPENVNLDTLVKKMSPNGMLYLMYEKIIVLPRCQFEDLSDEHEFRIRINLPDYKPQDLSISVTDNSLKIEASKKYQSEEDDGESHSYCGFVSRKMSLENDVVAEKLKATVIADGLFEVSAPRDKNNAKRLTRQLLIEHS